MKKSAVLVCQLVVKRLIGNDPCNFKILGFHASLTSQSGQISIRKAPKMDVIHFFSEFFSFKPTFLALFLPFSFFWDPHLLLQLILRSWDWREDAHHKIVKLDQLNQLMFETRSQSWWNFHGHHPPLARWVFATSATSSRWIWRRTLAGWFGTLAAGCNHWGRPQSGWTSIQQNVTTGWRLLTLGQVDRKWPERLAKSAIAKSVAPVLCVTAWRL